MLVTIESVLDAPALRQVRRILDESSFVPGTASAGARAAKVKNNSELPLGAAELDALNNIVMSRLVQNSVYRDAVLPLKIAAPFYARYTSGMYYGPHVDDPVMGEGPRYRSDVSITVFLNAPDEYDGGELCVQTVFGEREIKLGAGSAVLYPSSSVHLIKEITRGVRLVAVTWAQSMVSSAEQRDLLFTLARARNELHETAADSDAATWVDQAYVNLVRMWSQV
ncbi:MAG: Fe2+-dependent dioxygenase [Proteobacteria bacterium]|nr:MAG: Fe2+-dependent dioxygenase [Pseudomonadota bacterium]